MTKMTKEKAKIIIGNIPINPENMDGCYTLSEYQEAKAMAIEALSEKRKGEKCIWIKYDYRTICPKECGGENPYWRIPENMENLKYCPYCGREIEVEND